jgi:uncharacterized protein (TIGR03435 family)
MSRCAAKIQQAVPLIALIFAITFAFVFAARFAGAQSSAANWEKAAGGKMSFDVASVKQDTAEPSAKTRHSNIRLGSQDSFSPTGGLLSATNYSLLEYIVFAYKLTNDQTGSISAQFPKWANTERFDIQAHASGDPSKDQYRLMMQTLLADRFKLAVHYETKEVKELALVLDKPGKLGPQLYSHRDDVSCVTSMVPQTGAVPKIAGGFPEACGTVVAEPLTRIGHVRVSGRAVTMGTFATSISARSEIGISQPVVDETKLMGTFDFILEFAPDVPAGVGFQGDPNGPTFLEGLKDQLGLKLESTTGPVDVLVIEHIEEPSPN